MMEDQLDESLVRAYQTKFLEDKYEDYKIRLDKIRNLLLSCPQPKQTGAFLLIFSKYVEPYWHKLESKETVIGRISEVDISLKHPWISKKHCMISHDGTDWLIQDCQSRNRMMVNERETQSQYLKDGDAIQLGNYLLIFTNVTQ